MLEDPSLALHNAAGEKMNAIWSGPPCDVWDLSNPRTAEIFIEECVNATKTGYVDGCFVDYAVDGWRNAVGGWPKLEREEPEKAKAFAAGHIQMLLDLQHALGDGPLIANHAYGPPHDAALPGSAHFAMIEGFASQPLNLSIQELLMTAKAGRGVVAHGKGGEDDLAAFLIGAHYRAYYGLGGWCDNSSDFRGHWLPQFELPLGEPLEDAEYFAIERTWRRQFAHGVNVTFDVGANRGEISGWQFPPPAPAPPLPRGC